MTVCEVADSRGTGFEGGDGFEMEYMSCMEGKEIS